MADFAQNAVLSNKPACTIKGCSKLRLAKGLCSMHYNRDHRHGDTQYHARAGVGAHLAWLNDHISFDGDECLIWPFKAKNLKGYGVTTTFGQTRNASNAMCRLAHGEPPTKDHESAHSCGHGHLGCVNPKHLRWATRRENHADKNLHGTMLRGEIHPSAKLTDRQISEIRASPEGMTALGAKMGISRGYVCTIRSGKARKDCAA